MKDIEFFLETVCPKDDRELLTINSCPHPFQTAAFWKFLDNNPCFYTKPGKQSYVRILRKNKLIGKCLISAGAGSDAGQVSWFYGPVTGDKGPAYNLILSRFLDYLHILGYKKIKSGTTQTNYQGGNVRINSSLISVEGEATVVDLGLSMNEIESNFHKSVRNFVRKCEKSNTGIDIFSGGKKLTSYTRMLSNFREKLGFSMPVLYPNRENVRLFSRFGGDMTVVAAVVEKIQVAAIGYLAIGPIVIQMANAQSDDFKKLGLPLNDLIHYKAICYFKEKGLKYYDLTGGEKNPTSTKEINLKFFKDKFSKTKKNFGIIRNKKIKANNAVDVADQYVHKYTLKIDTNYTQYLKYLLIDRYARSTDVCLDIGVANGLFAIPLAKRVKRVVGIDLNKQMLELCKRNAREAGLKNVITRKMDATELLFKNMSFELVFSFSTLTILEDADKAIAEISRVLKNGGIAVIDIANKNTLSYRKWNSYYQSHGQWGISAFEMKQIELVLKKAGFEILERHACGLLDQWKYVPVIGRLGFLDNIFHNSKLVPDIDYVISNLMPKLANRWYFVLRKNI